MFRPYHVFDSFLACAYWQVCQTNKVIHWIAIGPFHPVAEVVMSETYSVSVQIHQTHYAQWNFFNKLESGSSRQVMPNKAAISQVRRDSQSCVVAVWVPWISAVWDLPYFMAHKDGPYKGFVCRCFIAQLKRNDTPSVWEFHEALSPVSDSCRRDLSHIHFMGVSYSQNWCRM